MKSLAAGDVGFWFRDGLLTSRPRCLSNQFLAYMPSSWTCCRSKVRAGKPGCNKSFCLSAGKYGCRSGLHVDVCDLGIERARVL